MTARKEHGGPLEPKVYDGEFVEADQSGDQSGGRPGLAVNGGVHGDGVESPRAAVRAVVVALRVLGRWAVNGAVGLTGRATRRVVSAVRRVWRSPAGQQARTVVAYRVRKAPADLARLAWFTLRGHGRWLGKAWTWFTYGDLRADARAARIAGDREARREAQEAIRADARARWARLGIVLHRSGITAVVVLVLAVVLWLTAAVLDRSQMWPWLAGVYDTLDALVAFVSVAGPWLLLAMLTGWLVAAAFEGRDRTPGVGWLVRPDRDDAGSWVDERMISRALAHLGITPLNKFFKDGGELVYTVPARKDGDGTAAQIRLPLGVTADMVAGRRSQLAANLGRASLETWPTKGEEDGVLDLWVADKGVLRGSAGDWPLLHDGQSDVFEGVPFGLTQRGLVINAPLIGVNWLVGGRPGQGKSSALRTLMLGAALDLTVELWAFVMGESPDFDPFQPRLARYRMGADDAVAEAATQALADLLEEMERRGRVLGEQPGRPPKVSRKLADKPGLGLHPLVCAIDECHELFQHHRFGKKAAELAVRLIRRGRKYGIVLLLATQSPTKDSIPREITRNVSCGVAFSVADQVANDGLLGSGKYAAGIRATELRINTDRGTCVAVGITDETFELVRTFYVPFEDGTDDVSPVIARAMALIEDAGHSVASSARAAIEPAQPVAPDHLADIAEVMQGERRVRTQVVLTRLSTHNPDHYEGWTFRDLTAALADHGITARKAHGGVKAIYAEDVAAALARRAQHAHRDEADGSDAAGDADGDQPGTRGVLPAPSPDQSPWTDQQEHATGTTGTHHPDNRRNPGNSGSSRGGGGSLPDDGTEMPGAADDG
ncbi:FtsK/SpoIIIE domain-containing protein [Labedaea rhizosphaerae]|uniref:S-DNA-T family DNA segregation ATPase FtsK/SpoIIIE n=1 Tax=Labedaea rhizosphaerae TaxID=598644 RepID=A0A4R6RZT6_LABRH|nr:FtsK/SpoIIIE domain-containing protein [Labedaea rhizosphaerae]TDP91826.1 S-DNA-T family DNA segregation ATPase FtsK/SpoIIIE [Labedaea rhizosphaerae]